MLACLWIHLNCHHNRTITLQKKSGCQHNLKFLIIYFSSISQNDKPNVSNNKHRSGTGTILWPIYFSNVSVPNNMYKLTSKKNWRNTQVKSSLHKQNTDHKRSKINDMETSPRHPTYTRKFLKLLIFCIDLHKLCIALKRWNKVLVFHLHIKHINDGLFRSW